MSSVVLNGDSSGSVTLTVPSAAGSNTITFPASTGTVALTTTDYGGIGSYVIAAENDFTASQERFPDVTVAGSTLIRSTVAAGTQPNGFNGQSTTGVYSTSYTSLSLNGTWRRLSRSINSTSGTTSASNLYVRIS